MIGRAFRIGLPLLLLLTCFMSGSAVAQADSLVQRTTLTLGDVQTLEVPPIPSLTKEKKPHSPKKATILAMVLPGAGQIYNRSWWVPIYYGGAAAAIYGYSWNNKTYKKYRGAYVGYMQYVNELAVNPELPYPAENAWDVVFIPGQTAEGRDAKWFSDILLKRKNYYKRDRDLMIIIMGAIYVAQILDATVFAHFYDFNIDDNLSMRLEPAVQYAGSNTKVGLSLSVTF